MENEVKTIKDVQQILCRIPSINYGGCGISALAIARWLRKSELRVSTRFIFGQRDYKTFKQNAKAQISVNNKPSSASHIGVLIYDYTNNKQMVIDCDGTFDITSYSYANLSDEKFLLKSINECDQWNQDFDRIPYVQIIAEELDIDLSDVDLRTKKQYRDKTSGFISYEQKEEHNVGYAELAKAIVHA